jgi:hypothetical protein
LVWSWGYYTGFGRVGLLCRGGSSAYHDFLYHGTMDVLVVFEFTMSENMGKERWENLDAGHTDESGEKLVLVTTLPETGWSDERRKEVFSQAVGDRKERCSLSMDGYLVVDKNTPGTAMSCDAGGKYTEEQAEDYLLLGRVSDLYKEFPEVS